MIKKIFTTKRGENKEKLVGYLDLDSGLYQTAGELGKMVYWKARSVTFTPSSWEEISKSASRIEILDKKMNKTYSIDKDVAVANGLIIEAELGSFFAIPLDDFTVTNSITNNLANHAF